MENEEFAQALIAIGGAVLVGFAVAKLFDKRRAPASMSFGRSSFGYDPRVQEYDVIGGQNLDLLEPWEMSEYDAPDIYDIDPDEGLQVDYGAPVGARARDLWEEYGPTVKEHGRKGADLAWKGAKWGARKGWEGSKKIYGYAKSKAPGAWQYTKESAGWAGRAGRSAYEAGRSLDWEVPFKQRSSYRPIAPTLIDMPAPKTLVMEGPPPGMLDEPIRPMPVLQIGAATPNRRKRGKGRGYAMPGLADFRRRQREFQRIPHSRWRYEDEYDPGEYRPVAPGRCENIAGHVVDCRGGRPLHGRKLRSRTRRRRRW